jgi:hypothetical protein
VSGDDRERLYERSTELLLKGPEPLRRLSHRPVRC